LVLRQVECLLHNRDIDQNPANLQLVELQQNTKNDKYITTSTSVQKGEKYKKVTLVGVNCEMLNFIINLLSAESETTSG